MVASWGAKLSHFAGFHTAFARVNSSMFSTYFPQYFQQARTSEKAICSRTLFTGVRNLRFGHRALAGIAWFWPHTGRL